MSQSPPVQKLPDEIVYMILSKFNPIELTKLESVCKQWHHVSRLHTTLWRDALCGVRIVKLKKKGDPLLSTLLERGGGKLNDLSIEIDMSLCDLIAVRRFCKVLEASEIRNLWVELTWSMPDPENKTSVNIRTAKIRYGKAVIYVLESIAKCSKLQSLHIETLGVKNERIPSNMTSLPLAKCKLRRLSLKYVKSDPLFEGDLIYQMLKNPAVIDLENPEGAISEEDAIRLLENTKESLKECHLDIRESFGLPIQPVKSINLCNLTRLFLSIMNPLSTIDEQIQDQRATRVLQNITFVCPNLHTVYLEGRIPPNVYESLLTGEITSLYLNFLHSGHLPEQRLIQNCVKLKRLVLQSIMTMSQTFLLETIASTTQLPLNQLILEDDEPYRADHFVEAVKARQEQKNVSELYVFYLHDKPILSKEDLNWLIGNFPEFLPAHPQIWKEVMKCSFEDIAKHINIEPFYSRTSPMLLNRGHIDWPVGILY